jgi:hypothetical protein
MHDQREGTLIGANSRGDWRKVAVENAAHRAVTSGSVDRQPGFIAWVRVRIDLVRLGPKGRKIMSWFSGF